MYNLLDTIIRVHWRDSSISTAWAIFANMCTKKYLGVCLQYCHCQHARSCKARYTVILFAASSPRAAALAIAPLAPAPASPAAVAYSRDPMSRACFRRGRAKRNEFG